MSRPIRPTVARIDLGRLRANFRLLRERVAVEILAAVKGDAYGHGAEACARALEAEGCRFFGVALVEEGKALRRAGVRGRILCLGGVGHDGAEEAVAWDLVPVVYDLGTAERLDAIGRARGRRVPIHLKVDTGMGRLGVPPGEWEPFLDRLADLDALDVEGIATHLAEAEGGDPTFSLEQGRRFQEAVEAARLRAWRPRWLHLANSAAALRWLARGEAEREGGVPPEMRSNLARLGLALYGVAPAGMRVEGLRPVMRVETEVLFVKNVPAGWGLSYGRTWVAPRPSRIATLPLGYADGYPRALSNRAEVRIHGVRCPVRGVVCMDLTLVDVTDVPRQVRPGDRVEILGDHVTATELAERAGTIPYEILAGFSVRVPRAPA